MEPTQREQNQQAPGRSVQALNLRRRFKRRRRLKRFNRVIQAMARTTRLTIRHVRQHPVLSRYWGVLFLVAFIAAGAIHAWRLDETFIFVIQHATTLVALMPSLVAMVYLVLVPKPAYVSRLRILRAYQQLQTEIAGHLHSGKAFVLPFVEQKDDGRLDLLRPRPGQYFCSAVLLAAPFLLVAVFSDVINGIRGVEWYAQINPRVKGAVQGMTFAGYGVFVYTIVVMIHRIHAAALSSQFLLTTTLRAIVMMTIGLAVGETGLFIRTLPNPTGTQLELFMYFVIGVFPSWALEWLRKKARAILKPGVVADNLSLEYVDGMNEVVIERFEELGISNAQQLATADPLTLTLRTFYPLSRVIDWIDQAILITYLRGKILSARELGIRGAIDMSGLYRAALQPSSRLSTGEAPFVDSGQRARQVFQVLAERSASDDCTLYNIGESLSNDFHVNMLSYLWSQKGVIATSPPRERVGRKQVKPHGEEKMH